jgi:putative ABC transport system substrate-binding protein
MDRSRRALAAGLLGLLLAPLAPAQQAQRIHRIAHVVLNGPIYAPPAQAPPEEPTRRGFYLDRLAELGFVEGRNLEYRLFARRDGEIREGEPWRKQLIEEVLAWKPDLLFASTTGSAQHAQVLATGVPIVFANVQDPVSAGLVASLARPGSNVTGAAMHYDGLALKRVDMVREMLPKARRLVLLSDRAAGGVPEGARRDLARTAERVKLRMTHIDLADVEGGLCSAAKRVAEARPDAIVMFGNIGPPLRSPGADWISSGYGKCLAALQAAVRAPVFDDSVDTVKLGVAVALGEDQAESFHRAAEVTARILAGAKPADVPVDVQMRVRLHVNARSARELGIALPQSMLVRADSVVD